MKTLRKFLAGLMLLMFAVTFSTSPVEVKAQGYINIQFFYDHLSPYGYWVYYPAYGNVWIPAVPYGFRPYFTNGYWVYTSYGWMWVSGYSWGWATFHYGSWAYDPYYGWMWIPGYRWAPAWVTWGYYGGYYGWAPVGPWFAWGYSWVPPVSYWVFVHPFHLNSPDWHHHHYKASDNEIVFAHNNSIRDVNNISLINNSASYDGQSFNAGPSVAAIEKETGKKITAVSFKENTSPDKDVVNNNQVSVYRPKVNSSDFATAKPTKVTSLESLKNDVNKQTGMNSTSYGYSKNTEPVKYSVNTSPKNGNMNKISGGSYSGNMSGKGASDNNFKPVVNSSNNNANNTGRADNNSNSYRQPSEQKSGNVVNSGSISKTGTNATNPSGVQTSKTYPTRR